MATTLTSLQMAAYVDLSLDTGVTAGEATP